jgi:hypothetical protein
MRMRRLLELVPLCALLALATSPAGARPAETAVGGPAGAPNLTQDVTKKLIAQWPLLTAAGTTNARYYCADYDNGIDTRAGYVEGAVGSTLTACSANAVKTLTRLRAVIPSFGNGRTIVVLIKPRASGATYRNTANTADEGLDLTGVAGYAYFGLRGSTDLSNSASDRITLGAIQPVAGPGGGGAYTLAAGATTSVFSVAAGSFGAADAIVGYRFRFDAATTTAALRNVACFVNANTGTAITCGTNITAGAAGDIGYVEQPGVRIASLVTSHDQTLVVAGIACTSTTATSSKWFPTGSEFSFYENTGATDNQVLTTVFLASSTLNAFGGTVTVGRKYDDETGAQVTAGFGLRSANQSRLSVTFGVLTVGSSAFVRATATQTFAASQLFVGDGGSYFAKGPTILSSQGTAGQAITSLVGTTSASERSTRFVLGPVSLSGALRVQAVDASNSASSGVVLLAVAGARSSFSFTTVTGTTNTTWGIDASALTGAQLVFANSNTITGTSGEVQTAGAARLTMTDLTLTNVVDNFQNSYIGVAGVVVGQATLVSNQSGGALAVGNLVKSNGTTGQVTGAFKADTNAANAHVECVMVTSPASTAPGYCVGPGNGTPYVLYDGAPAVGAIAYLSVGTNGKGTTTVPPVAGTNMKIRLGRVLTASGNTGYTAFGPDWLAVAADGAP